MAARFILIVATSADGFIARGSGDTPADWASPEEQALFLEAVDAADWSVMGRRTHEAADRPDRRRIVFSATAPPGWHRPSQLWLDPAGLDPGDLVTRVGHIRPLREGLILGGTRVHDWFHARRAIDEVRLTIEPLHFGTGLPVFSAQTAADPLDTFAARGYAAVSERHLNVGGTRYLTLEPVAR